MRNLKDWNLVYYALCDKLPMSWRKRYTTCIADENLIFKLSQKVAHICTANSRITYCLRNPKLKLFRTLLQQAPAILHFYAPLTDLLTNKCKSLRIPLRVGISRVCIRLTRRKPLPRTKVYNVTMFCAQSSRTAAAAWIRNIYNRACGVRGK